MTNLNPSMKKDTSNIKCGMKLYIRSQTSVMQPFEFRNEYVISSHTVLGMWLLIHAGSKFIRVSGTLVESHGLNQTCVSDPSSAIVLSMQHEPIIDVHADGFRIATAS